jgi:hypothetical protein
MKKFKVQTQDSVMFISRIFVLEGESKEEVLQYIKLKFPNSYVQKIEEVAPEGTR